MKPIFTHMIGAILGAFGGDLWLDGSKSLTRKETRQSIPFKPAAKTWDETVKARNQAVDEIYDNASKWSYVYSSLPNNLFYEPYGNITGKGRGYAKQQRQARKRKRIKARLTK